MTDDLTKEAAFWDHWRLKGTGAPIEALWRSRSDFLRDWDKPLDELDPGDDSRVRDKIRCTWIARLVEDVCAAGEKLGLPAESPPANELVDRLEAILDGSRGRIPSITYAKLYRLREWLTAAMAPEGPTLPAGGLSGSSGLVLPSGRPEPSYERLGAGDVVTAPERPASAPTKRKRKLFYGWRVGGEYRVSLVPPDGPHRPSVAFESRAEAEEWADRKRADVWWSEGDALK